MYNLKINLIDDLKGGRTSRYIAKILDVTESYISMIFNNKIKCTKIIAMGIISIRYNIALDNEDMEKLLKKYFMKT